MGPGWRLSPAGTRLLYLYTYYSNALLPSSTAIAAATRLAYTVYIYTHTPQQQQKVE